MEWNQISADTEVTAVQETSELYKKITKTGKYATETSLVIGTGTPDDGYGHEILITLKTTNNVLGTGAIGKVSVGEIDVEMLVPDEVIPKQATLLPYIRVTDGKERSEWLPKGEYLLDTRKVNRRTNGRNTITLHGYDRLITAQMEFDTSQIIWPANDITIVTQIATQLGIKVDDRTVSAINLGYVCDEPLSYSCSEILGYIAAMYGGAFCMGDNRKLRLIQIKGGSS